MSGWPAGYQTTVTNGHCDKCGQFRRVRGFENDIVGLKWLCKSCAKQPPKTPATPNECPQCRGDGYINTHVELIMQLLAERIPEACRTFSDKPQPNAFAANIAHEILALLPPDAGERG